MDIELVVASVICALLLAYVITLFNGLVFLKHGVSRNLANIDVLLKQRHDEIPRLVAVCRQYMQYEQETLAQVVRARHRVDMALTRRNMKALGQA